MGLVCTYLRHNLLRTSTSYEYVSREDGFLMNNNIEFEEQSTYPDIITHQKDNAANKNNGSEVTHIMCESTLIYVALFHLLVA